MSVLLIGVSLLILIGLRHRWIAPRSSQPESSPETSPP